MHGVERLLAGLENRALERLSDREGGEPLLIMPGSFDPVHASHLRIARLAAGRRGRPVDLELSVRNVEKADLGVEAVRGRVSGLREAVSEMAEVGHLWLTSAPTFVEKARLFPGAEFVVGLDTFRRVADPRFHGGDEGHREAMAELVGLGARFLVFFRHADEVEGWDDPGRYPEVLAGMAEFIRREEYGDEGRMASREIRRRGGRG